MNRSPDNRWFQVGQKAFVRRGDRVLVMLFSGGHVDFPGGRVQEGEDDLIESLRREVREETSLEIDVGRPFTSWISPGGIYLVGYDCAFRSGEVRVSAEHESYRWVSQHDFTRLDDGGAAFAQLVRYFGDRSAI